MIAAEDYTGLSPNKTPYDDAPRYLDAHKAALEANGYAVETYDVDAPPLGPNGAPVSKQISDLGVLSHFDAVLYYTGDDLLPQEVGQGVTAENYRRLVGHAERPGRLRAHRVPAPDDVGRAQRADAAQLHERGRQGAVHGPQRLGPADQHQHRPEHVLGLQLVAGARVRLRLPAGPGG